MDLTNYQSFLSNILFILVIYKVNLDDSNSFQALINCCEDSAIKIDIFIYDNSPLSLVSKNQISKYKSNVYYVHDKTNPGVSKAYNQGNKLAKNLNKKWLFLLDQDTQFNQKDLIKYYQSVIDNNDIKLFAPILVSSHSNIIYSPCRYLFKKGFCLKNVETGRQKLTQKSVLNSGLLIDTEMFNQIGGYNEKLKLDFSDFDFIDRYRKNNNLFFVVSCYFKHDLSSTDNNVDNVLNRFRYYCESVKNLLKYDFDILMLLIIVLFRTLKLSFRHKTYKFLSIFFSIFK